MDLIHIIDYGAVLDVTDVIKINNASHYASLREYAPACGCAAEISFYADDTSICPEYTLACRTESPCGHALEACSYGFISPECFSFVQLVI